jgi:hypothetical protein
MKNSGIISVVLVCFLVGSSMAPFVSAAGGTTNSSGEVWTDGPGNATDWNRHGLDIDEMYQLWSGDAESRSAWMFSDDSEIQSYLNSNGITGQDREDILSLRETAAGTDYEFLYPPGSLVKKWNDNDIGAYTLASSDQTSYAPQGKNVTDGRFIKDAFITEYMIDPMTVAHVDGASESRMISADGNATVLVDYLIDVPSTSGSYWGSGRVFWRLIDSDIETVRVSDGTCSIDDTSCAYGYGPADHVSTIGYDNFSIYDNEFVYETNLTVEMEKKVVKKYRHKHCGNCSRHTHTKTRYYTVTESMVVEERKPVEVNTLLTLNVAFGEYPNGEYVMYVDGDRTELWGGAVTEGTRVGISSGLTYYTHRNTNWDNLTKYTEDRPSTVEASTIHPVEVHAFPAERGPEQYERGKDVGEIIAFSETNRSTPVLHPNVDVRLAQNDFSVGEDIVYRFDPRQNIKNNTTGYFNFKSSGGERVEILGVVDGEREVINDSKVQLLDTNMSVEVLGPRNSSGAVPVKITLTEEVSGNPVDLKSSRSLTGGQRAKWGQFATADGNGYVKLFDGQKVYTNSTGEVVVNVTPGSSGYVAAEYVPRPWWEIKTSVTSGSVQPYLASNSAARVETQLPNIVELIAPIIIIFALIYGLLRLLGNTVGSRIDIGGIIRRFLGLE